MRLRQLLVLHVTVAAVAAFAVALWRIFGEAGPPAAQSPSVRSAPVMPEPAEPGGNGTRPAEAPPEPAGPAHAALDPEAALVAGLRAEDLAAVRAALPDNLYWQTTAPSDDAALLAQRAQERARNDQLAEKIAAGTASGDELLAYYEQRARASRDVVQLADYLLEHYQSVLAAEDVALLQIAKRLHLARLDEIPRRLLEARERSAPASPEPGDVATRRATPPG